MALFNVGNALGFRATEVLRRLMDTVGPAGGYAHFALTDRNEAMSWVLSRRSVASLDREWPNNADPYRTLGSFMGWR